MYKQDYINFIVFFQPDKSLEVSTLVRKRGGKYDVTNCFYWDSFNKSLKEMQAECMDNLKISGAHLPLYGPYERYNTEEGTSYREFYQGIYVNSNGIIPTGFIPFACRDIRNLVNDSTFNKVYGLMCNELQDYIYRKNNGY